ncbi:A nuclease of the HNH/ENDO VII superwith conserved AHH family protein [Orientia tsutsugamushi str. UT144]|uniref:A nuclease of the HNH/ENDO VII superwith conserved AHH family protein n=1 Tax=Orientia tsutsugamushi str. UT144 TaxID=1441384 RepID=A0A0F3RN74_ORITS|nr:hypothetical protein [Orientia tsutsugamushi]KJW07486.1 A nuclease of the HNH/ENDO VII superwith conserved AHH family protein [Orientia tsutsugamushi str. UT144]
MTLDYLRNPKFLSILRLKRLLIQNIKVYKGLELATESSNIVRDTYAKMLKKLNPSLTQKEIQIISKWKVSPPNQQSSTHSGWHDNSYVLPIKEKLDDLWKNVKLGKLNKEECRKAVYDLMAELREGIKNGSIKLNKEK